MCFQIFEIAANPCPAQLNNHGKSKTSCRGNFKNMILLAVHSFLFQTFMSLQNSSCSFSPQFTASLKFLAVCIESWEQRKP